MRRDPGARGGMWKLQGERTSDAHARGASRPNSLLCLARTGRHLLLATLRCPPAFDSKGQCEARQEPWLTEPALAALAASGCCAPPCGSGALIARMLDKQRGEQPSVGAREDGTELDAPVPVLPTPYCTALDGQDFNACVTFVERATALCCCNSWPPQSFTRGVGRMRLSRTCTM